MERSAGAVIFRKEAGKIFYLLLRYPARTGRAKREYWDFPKGHINSGETIEDTVKREVQEETGLTDIEFTEGFQLKIRYYLTKNQQKILKTVVFLLAEAKTKNIKISDEHTGFQWLPYEEALKRLVFKNAKNILEKADSVLK
ncbi:MAG: NUDIX domain-containing protein [Candidatus Nealsonbacteria bacterium]|nr:NUDIX domain-containing protein [Candidatus Nealsonbacteria bacterium]